MIVRDLQFQDFDFPHDFGWCRTSDGQVQRRWLPYGMPRLHPAFSRDVLFFYGANPKTGAIEPVGSGLIVGFPKSTGLGYIGHYYAVTCHHVMRSASSFRLTTRDGKSRTIEFESREWQAALSGDDLAALDMTEQVSAITDEISVTSVGLIADQKFIRAFELGIGEDGFMLGLFADMPGKDQNQVVARFGNIGLLASDDNLIRQGNDAERPSHLFDMRSRPGFSGSPVYVYRTPSADLRDVTHGPAFQRFASVSDPFRKYHVQVYEQQDLQKNTFVRLLGIHSGQYHDTVKVTSKDDSRREEMRIPNSMTVVIPAWEVVNLLFQDKFKDQRRAREARKGDSKVEPESATADTSRGGEAPQATVPEADPNHRERFNLLASAAAKRKPSDDRT